MKTSYTKRALAFWLAVAMVATSAPMAFAADLVTGAPTSSTVTSEPAPQNAQAITSVTLKNGDQGISKVVVTGAKVTTDGSTDVGTLTAVLNDNIPVTNVTWSVSGPDAGSVKVADGTITVEAKAKAGEYTIKASAKEQATTGSAEAKLIVERKDENVATSVAVSDGAS